MGWNYFLIKWSHDEILKGEPKKRHLSIVLKSCSIAKYII